MPGTRPRSGAAPGEAHREALRRASSPRPTSRSSRRSATGLRVHSTAKEAPAPELFDRVLVAVGGVPTAGPLVPTAAGVAVDERGIIGVDKQLRTNVPHIFASVTLRAHRCWHTRQVTSAKTAAEVAAGRKSSFDARGDPLGCPTPDPEIAWVGCNRDRGEGAAYRLQEGHVSRGWRVAVRSRSTGTRDSPSCSSTSQCIEYRAGYRRHECGRPHRRSRTGDRDGRRRGGHRL